MNDSEFLEFLDDEIDKWHDGPIPLELHQHLRMSWEEYGKWVRDNVLPIDMKARWNIK